MLVFEEREKPENPEKNLSRSKDENEQQTQHTYDTESGNRTHLIEPGPHWWEANAQPLHHLCSPNIGEAVDRLDDLTLSANRNVQT